MNRLLITGLLLWGVLAHESPAQEAGALGEKEAAIRAADAAYVKAFNEQDAAALAVLWSPEAVYTNRLTGEQVTGREEIAKQFAVTFQENKGMQVELDVESIQFISPNAAVEHGVAVLTIPDAEPESIEYAAVFVRRDGKWLLDNVTDKEPTAPPPSRYEQLKELEWLIGSWVDEDDSARIVTECNWTKNQNFITRSFTVEIDGVVDMSGMQVIGWDPAAKQIRSWTFDSDGGFAEGAWTKQDATWYVSKKGTLADGSRVAAVNILKYIDADTCTIQSVQRAMGGELLPNINEVRVVRVQ